MATVAIKTSAGTLLELLLATDDQGQPLFKHGVQDFLQPSVQVGEAGYASFLPRIGGVYALSDFSGGVGSKVQKGSSDKDANRYWYAEGADGSAGYLQKGPAVTTLSAPSNSGAMSGYFELSSVPYLVMGRRIASWASDTLTAKHDFTVGIAGANAAVFSKLAAEGSVESNGTTSTTSALSSSDHRLAQSFRLDDTGVRFLSSVSLLLTLTGTVTGDVRLSIEADLNGKPSGQIITSSRILAASVPTSATAMTFRFDDDDTLALAYNVPYWLVLDAAGAGGANTMAWSTTNNSDVYARGQGYRSDTGGNTWSAINTNSDFYFDVLAKTATTTIFVGVSTGGQFFKTSTDGASYSADTYRASANFAVVSGRLVRSVQHGTASSDLGAVEWSDDGTNWNSDIIVVGDPSVPITNLVALGDTLLVCKEDGIYAVDINDTFDVQPVETGGRLSTNGLGACNWKGTAYVPFGGRLVAVQGDVIGGFTVFNDVGPTVLKGWGFPHGPGRVVAVYGDRFHLYAALSATGGYRLYKASQPLKQTSDGEADPNWHGSLTRAGAMGDGTNSITMLAIFDPGGTSNPQLFFTIDTSGNIGRITLPRTADPSADSSYVYDTGGVGSCYLPVATGGFPVHPKAWIADAVTFAEPPNPSDYADVLFDQGDREGYKRLGRVFDSDVLPYELGALSRLLGRRIDISNAASTSSPLVQAVGLTGAVRPVEGEEGPFQITFTAVAQDGLSGESIGHMLGALRTTERKALAKSTRMGTRTLLGPDGEEYRKVLFLDALDVRASEVGADHTLGSNLVQVTAVQVG